MSGRRGGAFGAFGASGAAVVLLGAAGAGCDSPTEAAAERGGVRAEAARDSLRVTNGTARPVFTFVVSASLLPRINWAACADAAVCRPIPPGATEATPRARLYTEPGDRTLAVLWWHAGPRVDGVVRPDSIRGFTVELP